MKTKLMLVGGFLGAGKTTLLYEAAKLLMLDGHKVGIITNDQAAELVDTALLSTISQHVKEVSGSCFCCNFNGFVAAIDYLTAANPGGYILAEPVGSCTDLSATIMQPLKEQFASTIDSAPLTVLADPQRIASLLAGDILGLHKSAAYIIEKQFEEADIILISKVDLLTEAEKIALKRQVEAKWKKALVRCVSAKTGEGLAEWLAESMASQDAGTHLAKVDYDIYAEGEAVLGWLNMAVTLRGAEVNWREFSLSLLAGLSDELDAINATVGHVKLILQSGEQLLMGNLTGKKATLNVRGSLENIDHAQLTFNARVEMSPDMLEKLVKEQLSKACGKNIVFKIEALQCLSPGRPNPTYRYADVVK